VELNQSNAQWGRALTIQMHQFFANFCSKSAHFSNIFKRFALVFEYFQTFRASFRIFSNVFERFYFTWLAQSLHPNPLTLIFNPKTRIAPEKIPPIPPFSPNSG